MAILILVLLLVVGLKLTLATAVVDGTSMLPTLKPGQYLVVSRLFAPPKPGDLVVIDHWMNGRPMVKRVYKVGGQLVEWQRSPIYFSTTEALKPFFVPQGTVYLLGDNAPESEDSRYFGPVPLDRILGKVIARR